MAITQVYVDPSIADNSGAGTKISPHGDLQYSLDRSGMDYTKGANGTQINIKAGTAEVLTAKLDFSIFGAAPTEAANVTFRGYTTDENDGGIGEVNVNGETSFINEISMDYIRIFDLYLHGSSGVMIRLDNSAVIINCRIEDAVIGIQVDLYGWIEANQLTNIGGTQCIQVTGDSSVHANYYQHHATKQPTYVIGLLGIRDSAYRNIISLGGNSNGIRIASEKQTVVHNSLLAAGTTGGGIVFAANSTDSHIIKNNIISGFSGTGGDGINFATTVRALAYYGGNAFYDCETDELNIGDALGFPFPGTSILRDNESLGADPFAKSGSDTFANRFVYFAPNDVGNVLSGALDGDVQNGLSKGAVQAGTSAASSLVIVNRKPRR